MQELALITLCWIFSQTSLDFILFLLLCSWVRRNVDLVVVKSQEVRIAINSFVLCLNTVHSVLQVDHSNSCLVERIVCPPPSSSSPPSQDCPVELSEVILSALSTRVAICHMWLLSTWNVVNVTEDLNFKFHLISINFSLNLDRHM